MVKVGSMNRAKRVLVIAGMLLVAVTSAQARLWGRKADRKAAPEVALSAITLSAVEVDGSRILLRTSGAPAYTSYSPSHGVFVVDLTGTTPDASLSVPTSDLPPAVSSIAAEEVVEMGSRLTRVTVRLSDVTTPEVTASGDAVVVTVPSAAVAIQDEPAAVRTAAIVDPVREVPVTAAEPVEIPVEVEEEPVVETALPRARTLRRIETTPAAGGVAIRLSADGELRYKAFRLENPPRLVIDLQGVKNAVRNPLVVEDEVVLGVRAGQFQPDVARVVVDLAGKSEYRVRARGEDLLVAFGEASLAAEETPAAAQTAAVATPVKIEPAPAPAPAVVESDSIPARVPVVAENAPAWKMPDTASKGVKGVINAPADQAAPSSAQRPREDVFAEAVDQGQTAAPGMQTLTSRTLSSGPRVFSGEPISLNLKDADIKDVIRTFAELTGLNIAVDPGVGGSVTVDFVEVPWDQALDLILRQNSLTYMIEGNVMRIGTIARIAAETKATRELAEEERLNVPLTTLSFKLSYARAGEVQGLLRDIASPRARIIVDTRTNQLIISEIPEFLRTMQNLITTIDVPTRQVMIEARIVESSRTFTQQWGVDWGFGGNLDPALGTGTGLVFPNRIGYEAGPFQFAAGKQVLQLSLMDVLGTFDLDIALAAAEAQGYIKVVSAPRVTTQDNSSASIMSGVQIPYQTRINFTTTISYLNATLNLQVTPQITEAGTVIMQISVQKNEPAPGLALVGAAGTPLTTRQAQTTLMVRDGGTAVIAGIFQTKDNNSQSRVPFVHNIPVIGSLFKSHDISTSHDELLIFITPRIVRG